MDKEMIPQVALNSGYRMPLIGLGTACDHIPGNLTSTLINAIELGYRHIDTASLYKTEEFVGQAIAQALERGLIDNRSDVFVTSKLWCSDADHDLVLPALKETLQKLGLDYVDLYLVHFPLRINQGTGTPFQKDEILPFDMKGTWEAMEVCCRLGLAKSIGVSNFSSKKLSQLLTYATIPPAVNQISLRWAYQQGASPIVKSFNEERMKENLQIFDWELTQEELDKINQIPQKRGYPGEMFVSPNGPYKSLEELWDEEV
ncbi:NADPH-dependent codeinone reductase 1-4-like isoform X3 [Telopea speciosissima]|uniref:NADPH-dependent codeinone reductase 1-4-like isoform X3 n=1 Tax=Telopea speciosissima TaxID=54955 RepID=UPI001CC6C444|nr:NADPH-dependent codeinone reductase 1-4-like isoform X3 [Telopea speciosissima]